MILCADPEASTTRTRLPMPRCLRGGDCGAQCGASADRGHSARIQWPVIPTVPHLSRYGADATSCPIGHSVVSSRRLAEIAGVVGTLMGRDALLGRLVVAGATGYCQASLERYGESLSHSRLYAQGLGRDGDWAPCRGLPREASCEAEIRQGVETSRARPKARRRAGGLGRGRWLTHGLPSGFVVDGV